MECPFPGMDPYLEHPDVWHPYHTQLIARLAEQISDLLPSGYYVSVEARAVIAMPGEEQKQWRRPDLGIVATRRAPDSTTSAPSGISGGVAVVVPVPEIEQERFLEVRSAGAMGRLVTTIEVLSPSNKISGDDRGDYLVKRGSILGSRTSLVEIDLLRAGAPMPLTAPVERKDYSVLVSRGWERPGGILLPFSIRDAAPAFPLPLLKDDLEPLVSLQQAIRHVYEVGRYWMRCDYSGPVSPPFTANDSQWVEGRLRECGLK